MTSMAVSSERRRSSRQKKDIGDGIDIQFNVQGGGTKGVSAKLVDLTEFGCGLDIRFAMPVGVDVLVRSRFFDDSSIKTHERKAPW